MQILTKLSVSLSHTTSSSSSSAALLFSKSLRPNFFHHLKNPFSYPIQPNRRRALFSSSPSMESAAVTVESVADKLKKQSLGNDGSNSKRMLKLEELNWDHSFVRELPADPRTDTIPREVFFFFLNSPFFCFCLYLRFFFMLYEIGF